MVIKYPLLVVAFHNVDFDEILFDNLIKNGVKFPSVEEHSIAKGHYQNYIMIGYSNLPDYEIVGGIKRIRKVIKQ